MENKKNNKSYSSNNLDQIKPKLLKRDIKIISNKKENIIPSVFNINKPARKKSAQNTNESYPKNAGLSKPKSMPTSKSVKEPHAFSDYNGRLLFADFDRNKHRDLIFINHEGKLIKYQFNKKKNGKMEPISMVQWI